MTAAVENPYVGPRTFEEKDSQFFFGREREARDLLSLVIAEPLVLFYAQSGAGKSSLINTRLIPALRQEEFVVLPVGRVGGELPEGVKEVNNVFVYNLLLSLCQKGVEASQLTQTTLTDFLQAHKASLADEESARVLIIDQFEEIATTHLARWPEREEFFRQLNQAIKDDPLLWVVLTLREDYVAALRPYSRIMYSNMRARFYMQRMEAEAAQEAIEKPAAQAGRPFAPGVATSLVDNLRQLRTQQQDQPALGQFVEPVQLQVVCYQLWENLKGSDRAEITQQDIEHLGDVDTALAQFYEQAIARVLQKTDTSEVVLRNWFERQLVTEAGTRGIVYQGARETAGLDNEVVQLLANQFLLRPEIRAGGTWYELVHDRFVEPILQANQVWRSQQSPLLRAAEAWDRAGRRRDMLYRDDQLKGVLASVNRETLEPIVQEFLTAGEDAQSQRDLRAAEAMAREQKQRAEAKARTARLLQWLSIGLIIAILAAAAFAAFAVEQRDVAQGNAAAEMMARATSDANAGLAATRAAEAEFAQATAVFNEQLAATRETQAQAAQEAAEANEAAARISADLAMSRQLASQAANSLNSDPQLGLLLAIEANNITHTLAADDTLRQALQLSQAQAIWRSRGGEVKIIDFSSDGTLLAMGHDDGSVSLRNVIDGKEIARVPALENSRADIAALSFVSFGDELLTVSESGEFTWWYTGCISQIPVRYIESCIGNRNQQNIEVEAAVFGDDGQRLIVADKNDVVSMWYISPPDPISFSEEPIITEVPALSPITIAESVTIQALAASSDGSRLVTIDDDGLAHLWNLADLAAEPVPLIDDEGTSGYTVAAFSPDNQTIALGGSDGHISLWQAMTGEPLFVMPEGNSSVMRLTFNNEGSLLAAANANNGVQVWDTTNGRLITVLTGHTAIINTMAFTPDDTLLVTGSGDTTVRLWSVAAREAQPILRVQNGITVDVTFDDPYLLTAEVLLEDFTEFPAGSRIRLWDVNAIVDAGFTDEALIYPQTYDDVIFPLDVNEATGLLAISNFTLDQEQAPPNTNHVALWNMATLLQDDGDRAPLASLPNQPDEFIQAIVLSPDNRFLAAGGINLAPGFEQLPGPPGFVRIWEVMAGLEAQVENQTIEPLVTLPLKGPVWDLASNPDGSILAGVTDDFGRVMVILWAVPDGTEIASFPIEANLSEGFWGPRALLAFSPDGTLLVTGGADNSVQLLSVDQLGTAGNADAAVVATLRGHEGALTDAAFNLDGTILATGSEDGTIRLWDVAGAQERGGTGAEFTVLRGHTAVTTNVAFSLDGRFLASSSDDGTVRLWTISTDELAVQACAHATRNLSQSEWEFYLGRDEDYRRTCSNLPPYPTAVRAIIEKENLVSSPLDEAVASLDAFIGMDDSPEQRAAMADALLGLGEAYAGEGQVDEALVAFQRVVELAETLAEARQLLVARELVTITIAALSHRPAEMLALLEQAYALVPSLKPEISQQLEELARVYAYQNQPDDALAVLQRGQELYIADETLIPEQIVALFLVEVARFDYVYRGMADEALAALLRAFELDPATKADVLRGLAEVVGAYMRQDRQEEALAALQEAAVAHPALELQPEAIVAAGLVEAARELAFQDMADEALATLLQAFELDPATKADVASDLVEVAGAYIRQDRQEEALAAIQEAAAAYPALELQPEAILAAGLIQASSELAAFQGNTEDALEALQNALALDPTFESERPARLATAFNVICQYADLASITEDVLMACRKAIELAAIVEDAFLNFELCQLQGVATLADLVEPACARFLDQVKTLSLNEPVHGVVEAFGGELWALTGSAGQQITIRMDKDNSELDALVRLYGPDSSFLMEDHQSGGDNNALITGFALPEAGTYLIIARGWADTFGTYELEVTGEDTP